MNEYITNFMGHPLDYWAELEKRFQAGAGSPRASDLLEEIIKLRAKVSFYESRISEMAGMLPK